MSSDTAFIPGTGRDRLSGGGVVGDTRNGFRKCVVHVSLNLVQR